MKIVKDLLTKLIKTVADYDVRSKLFRNSREQKMQT